MDNQSLARVFAEIADLLEIKGENAFRVRSYRMAAESVQDHPAPLADLVRAGDPLKGITGVGDAIAAKIRELVTTGRCAAHQELLTEVPGGLLELLRIPGLGPKGVALIWRQLGVTGPADLEAAIADGRFRTLPGMKEKKEERIRRGLKDRASAQQRVLLPVAAEVVERLSAWLREHGASQVVAAGSFRRRRETVGDLDLVVLGDAAALSAAFVKHPDVAQVLGHGAAKTTVVLASGLQVDLRPFTEDTLGAALQYFTGSKEHNVRLRERAVRRGLKLNEYGVFDVETGEKRAGATEEDVYAALGLAFIPPEMREDRGEIAAAEAGPLPRLVERADILGDLHAHTDESDGRETLAAMVDGARARGLRYLALTEHSRAIPSRKHGSGMDEARCLAHIRRVREHQARVPDITLLAGIEVDILADGRLDMADDVLAQLDIVVASLHSHFELSREAQTDRVLRALANPNMDIWGHPLARHIGRREPVQIDFERVLKAAIEHGVALEINCQPDRLDLPDHLLRAAADKGARFVISTDSHAVSAFRHLEWGVAMARRGWLTAADILNTLPVAEFRSRLRSTRNS